MTALHTEWTRAMGIDAPIANAPMGGVAGGALAAVSSGRALAAVLAAGASGAWLGTAFAACTEGLLSDTLRRAPIAARDTDTMTTRVFDIALGYSWPETLPERVLRNAFTDRWDGSEDDLAATPDAREAIATAAATHDYRLAPINAGQGAGALTATRPAADVIDQMCRDARRLLDRWNASPA